MLLPLIVLAHIIGKRAERSAQSRRRYSSWLERLLIFRRHRISGVYVLVPLPSFFGAFILTTWFLILWLFSTVNVSPFIYFQF